MEEQSIPIRDLANYADGEMERVAEETIIFKKHTDRMTLSISNDSGEVVGQIGGYGLEVGFNCKFFKKEEDIQAAAEAIAELAVKLIMETMVKQVNDKVQEQL